MSLVSETDRKSPTPDALDIDAGVIEEARARQRRRRFAAVASTAAVGLAAVLFGFAWNGGGRGTAPARAPATPTRPLAGPPLGATHLRLIIADTPPAILDIDNGAITTVPGVVPGPYTKIGAPQVTAVTAAPGGAFAVVDRICRACANETGFFIGPSGSVTHAASGESIALDPGTTKVWVLNPGHDGCTLRLVPSSHAAVRSPCGLIGGVSGAGLLIDNQIVNPLTGAIRLRAEQPLYLLQGDLGLESNTLQQFNGGPGELTLVNLTSGARRRLAFPNMPRIQNSDSFNLQKVAVEPHGPLVALTFVNPWFAPGQAAYIWILDTRTGRLTLLPGFPVQEGIKASDAEWTGDDRLLVVSLDSTGTSQTRAALGVWTPGQATMPVRSIPHADGYWAFVASR